MIATQAKDEQQSARFLNKTPNLGEDNIGESLLQNNYQKLMQNSVIFQETSHFQNKAAVSEASRLKENGIGGHFVKANGEMKPEYYGSLQKSELQNKMSQLSAISRESDQSGCDLAEMSNQKTIRNSEMGALDSELYDYLKSKMVETNHDFAPKDSEKVAEEAGSEVKASCDFESKTSILEVDEKTNKFNDSDAHNEAKSGENEEGDKGSKEILVFRNEIPVSEEDERKMAESKMKLTSQVTDLRLDLENAESWLKKEQQYELNVTAANAKLKEKALKLLADVASIAQNFSAQVMELIERELSPGEEIVRNRVAEASKRAQQIQKATQEAENLLKEQDPIIFKSKIYGTLSETERCKEEKTQEESQEVKFDLAKLCPELERLSCELREGLGQVQRSLRSTFNPSEVTFDPDTLHPNLILSEDMKTVKFSAKKQEYAPSPKRFSSFYQVLSAQSFSSGVHMWEVELEGAPWMLGVCCASALPRSGLPSALESCSLSWVLMWSSNQLTALERARAVPLKKTSEVSRTLRVQLDQDRQQLSFYHLSLSGASSFIHSFTVDTEEPLQLAYRMLSGDARGRLTIRS